MTTHPGPWPAAFNRIAWPAFAVLVVTGVWNLVELPVGDFDTEWQVTLFVKIMVVAVAGVAAAVHAGVRSRAAGRRDRRGRRRGLDRGRRARDHAARLIRPAADAAPEPGGRRPVSPPGRGPRRRARWTSAWSCVGQLAHHPARRPGPCRRPAAGAIGSPTTSTTLWGLMNLAPTGMASSEPPMPTGTRGTPARAAT